MSYAKREQALQTLLDLQGKRRLGFRLTLADNNKGEEIHKQYPEYENIIQEISQNHLALILQTLRCLKEGRKDQ